MFLASIDGPGEPKLIGRRAFLSLLGGMVAFLFVPTALERLSRVFGAVLYIGGFVINSVAPAPAFAPERWRLAVDGQVDKPLQLAAADVHRLPRVEMTKDFACVDGWGVRDVRWAGVPVGQLLATAGTRSNATHIVFHSGDGVYSDSLTVAQARGPDVVLAYEMNGQPLTVEHGFPLRLVVAGSYGYKSVKWVEKVEAVSLGSDGYKGYWEKQGYPAQAGIL